MPGFLAPSRRLEQGHVLEQFGRSAIHQPADHVEQGRVGTQRQQPLVVVDEAHQLAHVQVALVGRQLVTATGTRLKSGTAKSGAGAVDQVIDGGQGGADGI